MLGRARPVNFESSLVNSESSLLCLLDNGSSFALLWGCIAYLSLLFSEHGMYGDIVHDDNSAPKQPDCDNKFVLHLVFL